MSLSDIPPLRVEAPTLPPPRLVTARTAACTRPTGKGFLHDPNICRMIPTDDTHPLGYPLLLDVTPKKLRLLIPDAAPSERE